MQQTFVLGGAVRSTDGAHASISRIVFNPNTNHLDYLIVRAGPQEGRERFVAVRCIHDAGAEGVRLRIDGKELDELPPLDAGPRSPADGTVHSNLDDLCVADERTPVKDAGGTLLGQFHGVVVDENFDVVRVMLQGQDAEGVAVARLAPHGKDELMVQLSREVGAGL